MQVLFIMKKTINHEKENLRLKEKVLDEKNTYVNI